MEKEKEDNPLDAIRTLLDKAGMKEGEYALSYTKELKIVPIVPHQSLDTCLPYPISEKEGNCPICGEPYLQHSYMDFFIKPRHVKAIRNFLLFLINKHDTTKNMYLKLGTEAPSSVLTPKEMVLLLKELAQVNPNLANQFTAIFSHFIPSEEFKYETLTGVSRQLTTMQIHYEGLSGKWRTEFRYHKMLERPIIKLEEESSEETAESQTKTKEELEYDAFLQVHEKDAEADYFRIQSDFHRVASRVLAYAKIAEQFMKETPYGKVKRSLRSRAEKPIIYAPRIPTGFPSKHGGTPIP